LQGDHPLPLRQVDRLGRRPELNGHPDQVGEGIRIHLLHDPPTVCLYRQLTDAQFTTNLLV